MPYSPVLVFLGAGASHAFGVPTMKGMVRRLGERQTFLQPGERNLLERLSQRLGALYGEEYDLEKLLDVVHDLSLARPTRLALKQLAPRALYRYGEVLDRVGAQANLGERSADDSLMGDAATATSLETAITERIAEWCGEANFPAAKEAYSSLFPILGSYTNSLGRLGSVASQNHGGVPVPIASFVTTNYDECLDRTFSRLGVTVRSGFYHNTATRQTEFLVHRDPPGTEVPNTLPRDRGTAEPVLLKIHGSVSWWRTSDGRVVDLPGGVRGQELPDGATLVRREMSYPVATKDVVGIPYGVLYGWLAEALATATLWLFIGYSFGDATVVQLMDELLSQGTKVVIVGPHASTIGRTKLTAQLSQRAISVDDEFGNPELLPELGGALSRRP